MIVVAELTGWMLMHADALVAVAAVAAAVFIVVGGGGGPSCIDQAFVAFADDPSCC